MVGLVASVLEGRSGEIVSVLLPIPVTSAYDYRVPAGMAVKKGHYVRVPLGARAVPGVVWGRGSGQVAVAKIKPINALFQLPPMSAELRKLIDWVAHYYLAPPGAVLRMAMSVSTALEPPRYPKAYVDAGSRPKRVTPQRARVFAVLRDGLPRVGTNLCQLAAVAPAVVRGLAEAGHLRVVPSTSFPEPRRPDPNFFSPTLSNLQQAAAIKLRESVGAGRFAVHLLDGVTGSGKTEVYFEAIASALKASHQALVLLPEIALSAQWLSRFESRFGVRPAVWHSELGVAARRESWRAICTARTPLVVGTRSALFLPFAKLGLIVVDEEHDASYKQEDGVFYNARDVAVMRGRLAEASVVLASATPSLESHHNANLGRYQRVSLPDRHGKAKLPYVEAIDMRREPPLRGRWISPALDAAVRETISVGEQVMLFLNRRGYAPLTLCRTCGFRLRCANCTAWLVEHRLTAKMCCHHCGHVEEITRECPECGSDASLVPCGPGVERLAEELAQVIPSARVKVMTSDTVATVGNAEKLVNDMLAHRIDILIGTQMVTKGYHFPSLTLVGVVDADLGLSGGDLRAGERSVQLLSQVSGRAGREQKAGRVLLQSYMTEHPVIRALVKGDRDGFLAAELAGRSAARMPPFARLAALIISSETESLAANVAADLVRVAPREDGVEVFGPAPAPIAQLRGRFRFRILVKVWRNCNMQTILRSWLASVSWTRATSVRVDVDPYSFM